MAIATWKDLCVDALDPVTLGGFWAEVIGLRLDTSRPENVVLRGPTPPHAVWVNRVDRPRTVKNRLHLDVDCAERDDLLALGATLLEPAEETGFGWSVMADPEGHEFCAFVRGADALPPYRLHGIAIDSVDPERTARWWGEVLGAEPTREAGDDWWTLTGVAVDERMTLDFAPVPESRSARNRVHWDLWGDVEDVLAAGATHLWDGAAWTTLADPEGNEFCLFAPQP